jgi:diguanylate cyclase (GGDEF)-like protein
MKELLARIGRFSAVGALTIASAVITIAITAIAVTILNNFAYPVNFGMAIAFACIVPLLVTPLLGWPLVSLLMRIYQSEEKMRELASHDSLTGLLSRHAFFENGNSYISLAKRDKNMFSVVMIDLDHFKSINDKYGHQAGDAVLKLFSDVVNSVSRNSDIIGRLGGEEFGLVLPSTGSSEAVEFSQRLHQAIAKAVLKYKSDLIQYTVSIGCASYRADSDETLDDLLANADIALYQAKNSGRNGTAVFGDQDEQSAIA